MPQLRVLRSSKISCDGDGEAVNIGYTRNIQYSLSGGHRLTLPVAGLSQPFCLLLLFVVPPESACMYNAGFQSVSDRCGGHNIKLSEV